MRRGAKFFCAPASLDFYWRLIVMMMAVTMVVVPVLVLVMSVGVAMPMPVIMVFPAPGAFPIMPSASFMHVVRTGPICAGIGRPRIVTGDPAIVLALGRPETTYPDHGRFRWRWRCLDADGRRCYPDVDGDLRPGRRRESCCNNSESHTLFEHAALSLRTRNFCMNPAINLYCDPHASKQQHRHAVGGEALPPIARAAGADCRCPVSARADLLFQHIRQTVQIGAFPSHDEIRTSSGEAVIHGAGLTRGAGCGDGSNSALCDHLLDLLLDLRGSHLDNSSRKIFHGPQVVAVAHQPDANGRRRGSRMLCRCGGECIHSDSTVCGFGATAMFSATVEKCAPSWPARVVRSGSPAY